MTERAQKILLWMQEQTTSEFPIRQQTLAEFFNCSRRTIGRALKELKEAGLLTDLKKRHENRCKMHQIFPSPVSGEGAMRSVAGEVLTFEAQRQWELYEKTFRILFKMPNFEQLYAQVTWDLEGVKEEKELWSKTFAGLWAITGTMPTEKVFDPKRNRWFYQVI